LEWVLPNRGYSQVLKVKGSGAWPDIRILSHSSRKHDFTATALSPAM
jgi:hypothetical protein